VYIEGCGMINTALAVVHAHANCSLVEAVQYNVHLYSLEGR
jgi:hypothetical protein